MDKIEKIIEQRIEYFNNKDYEKIYDIYSIQSQFRQFFPEKDDYKEHFFKLIEIFLPVSIEIYKVLYNNEVAEILFLEKIKNLEEENVVSYYVKANFAREEGLWKIVKEEREIAYNK